MRLSSPYRSKDSFTLVELLVVIGILAILTAAVVIVLNPAELLKQSRDSKRTTDLAAVNNALKILLTQNPEVNLGTASTVYVSLADSSSTCGSYSLPTLPSGWQYRCVTAANLTKSDGSGWIPVSFASGASQLPALPTDPQNDANNRLYYAYAASNGRWELVSNFESDKYAAKEAADGGMDPAGYEVGSSASLLPFAGGLVGYWSLDEASGTTAYDVSGMGNDGTMYSSTTPSLLVTQSGCRQGGCANFDGSDDYIGVGAAGVDKPRVSIAVWLKMPAGVAATYKGIISAPTAFSNRWILANGSTSGSIAVAPNDLAGSGIKTSASFNDGAWHHVAVTTNPLGIFVDGVRQSTVVDSNNYLYRLGVTSMGGRPGYFFNGLMDDVRIYDRALSAGEIQAIYNATK
jgi:type II secretory pathway pseudopilin PulG